MKMHGKKGDEKIVASQERESVRERSESRHKRSIYPDDVHNLTTAQLSKQLRSVNKTQNFTLQLQRERNRHLTMNAIRGAEG